MMQAKDIMTKEVATISGSATVTDAVNLMRDRGLTALIVEPRSARDSYGIVTETDIVYKVFAFSYDPSKIRVFKIVTKPCIIVSPDLGVDYVARLFSQTKIRRAPVIADGLQGIISVSDIIRKSDFVENANTYFKVYDPEKASFLKRIKSV